MVTHATTDSAWSPLNTTDEIVAAVRAGEMVVILDDEERENEGDLVMAATKVRAEDVNFMSKYGRGLICLTLTRARCEQLRLPLMVSNTDLRQTTNFTISIEAAEGVTCLDQPRVGRCQRGALAVEAAVAIEERQLHGRVEQRLVLVLPVQVDQRADRFPQRRGRDELAIEEGAAPALRRDFASDD